MIRGTLQGKSPTMTPFALLNKRLTPIEQLEELGDEEQAQKDLKDMLSTLLQFV